MGGTRGGMSVWIGGEGGMNKWGVGGERGQERVCVYGLGKVVT